MKRRLSVSHYKNYRGRHWELDLDSYYLSALPPWVYRHTWCFRLVTIVALWGCPSALEKGKEEEQRVKGKWLLDLFLFFFFREKKTFLRNLTQLLLLIFIGQNGVTKPPLARRWLGKRELWMKVRWTLTSTHNSVCHPNEWWKNVNHQNKNKNCNICLK